MITKFSVLHVGQIELDNTANQELCEEQMEVLFKSRGAGDTPGGYTPTG